MIEAVALGALLVMNGGLTMHGILGNGVGAYIAYGLCMLLGLNPFFAACYALFTYMLMMVLELNANRQGIYSGATVMQSTPVYVDRGDRQEIEQDSNRDETFVSGYLHKVLPLIACLFLPALPIFPALNIIFVLIGVVAFAMRASISSEKFAQNGFSGIWVALVGMGIIYAVVSILVSVTANAGGIISADGKILGVPMMLWMSACGAARFIMLGMKNSSVQNQIKLRNKLGNQLSRNNYYSFADLYAIEVGVEANGFLNSNYDKYFGSTLWEKLILALVAFNLPGLSESLVIGNVNLKDPRDKSECSSWLGNTFSMFRTNCLVTGVIEGLCLRYLLDGKASGRFMFGDLLVSNGINTIFFNQFSIVFGIMLVAICLGSLILFFLPSFSVYCNPFVLSISPILTSLWLGGLFSLLLIICLVILWIALDDRDCLSLGILAPVIPIFLPFSSIPI